MSKCVPVCHFHPARESAGIPHCFTGVVLLLYDLIAWHSWSLGQLVGNTNINHYIVLSKSEGKGSESWLYGTAFPYEIMYEKSI